MSSNSKQEISFVPNREEFQEFLKHESCSNVMGLEEIKMSYENFLSPNSVTILAVGLSGVGVTSTLDHLMSRKGCANIDKHTDAILEHSFDWPSATFGFKNKKIIFVDTPGLGHPESSPETDLQSLKNVAKYFELKQYRPNFVLIIGNMAQPGIEKKEGRFIKFVKMAKKTLENTMIDLKNLNVMVVLTHMVQCIPSVLKDPSDVMRKVGDAVSSVLKPNDSHSVVVTVAENEVDGFLLQKVEEFFLLPNKDLYPKNLYEGMMTLAGKYDPVGYNVIKKVCQDFRLMQSIEFKTKVYAFTGLSLVPYSYFYESVPDRNEWLSYSKTRPLSVSQIQIHKSFAARRATNSATILFIGEAGAGKSSTINSMFGRKVVPVYDRPEEGSRNIKEYSVEVPSKNLRLANAKIHIVDTPGLNHPSETLDDDAQIYGNIRRYFQKRGFFPNAILLVANITHPLTSTTNPFTKLLRGLRAELQNNVLDPVRPNLLVVLTHLCSLPPIPQQDPRELVMSVKKLVMSILKIADVPVEVAENLFQDLREQSSMNHYFLPTKQWFPRNLFVRIAFTCLAGADPVGQQIINDGYLELPNKTVHTKVYPLEEIGGFAEVALGQIDTSTLEVNEVEQSLRSTWIKLHLEEKINCKLHLDDICDIINKNKIRTISQLFSSKRELMKLYQALDPNPGMELFLNKAIGIEVPRFDFDLKVGKGYDLQTDAVKDFALFFLGEPVLQQGIYLPKLVVSTLCSERKLIWLHSQSKQYLIRRRLSQLNIEPNERASKIHINMHPGFNLIHDYETLTAVYDFHWMKMELDDKCPWNLDFEPLLTTLLSSYKKWQRPQWQDFINQVGTHYVSTSYIGGSIIFEIKNLNSQSVRSLDHHSYNADAFLNYLLALPRVLPTNREESNLNLRFIGGDPTKGEELRNSESRVEFFARLKRWEFAIWEKPCVSDIAVGLTQVADLVSNIDPKVGKALRAALKDLRNVDNRLEGCTIIQ